MMVEDKIHMRSHRSVLAHHAAAARRKAHRAEDSDSEKWKSGRFSDHGAAYTLREMLTIKSDDIMGRSAAFDSIVKGEKIKQPNLPASFNVLLNSLRGLRSTSNSRTIKMKR